MTTRDKIFVSYSHKDGRLFEELKTMLAPAIQRGLVDLWDDKKIPPGGKWKEEIQRALASASIAVLLVSQNFLASHFIAEHELPPLLKAAQEEGVTIFWIYLSSCLFEQTEIASYQAAHDTSRPLDRLTKPQRQAILSETCAKLIRAAALKPPTFVDDFRNGTKYWTQREQTNKSAGPAERVIYDGSKTATGYDFRGVEGHLWSWSEAEGKFVRSSPKGTGDLNFEKGGILNLRRTNADGRYEIWLQRYLCDRVERAFIPKNELIAGQRKLRVSFEAKVLGGTHTLVFVLKDNNSQHWLANQSRRIVENEWTQIQLYFQFSPAQDFVLRIDDQEVEKASSSVQIRNLVLAEDVA